MIGADAMGARRESREDFESGRCYASREGLMTTAAAPKRAEIKTHATDEVKRGETEVCSRRGGEPQRRACCGCLQSADKHRRCGSAAGFVEEAFGYVAEVAVGQRLHDPAVLLVRGTGHLRAGHGLAPAIETVPQTIREAGGVHITGTNCKRRGASRIR